MGGIPDDLSFSKEAIKLWSYDPKKTPQKYQAFFDRMQKKTDDTGEYLGPLWPYEFLRGENLLEARSSFERVCQNYPSYTTRVMEDALKIVEKDVSTAYAFLAHAPQVLSVKGGMYYTPWTELITTIAGKDRLAEVLITALDDHLRRIDNEQENYLSLLLETARKVAQIAPESTSEMAFIMELQIEEDQPPNPEDLLLSCIHDLKTAGIVSQVIDLQKYGKEYAEKIGRFY
jgi:hypothetical protein